MQMRNLLDNCHPNESRRFERIENVPHHHLFLPLPTICTAHESTVQIHEIDYKNTRKLLHKYTKFTTRTYKLHHTNGSRRFESIEHVPDHHPGLPSPTKLTTHKSTTQIHEIYLTKICNLQKKHTKFTSQVHEIHRIRCTQTSKRTRPNLSLGSWSEPGSFERGREEVRGREREHAN
jgi:hypothetical protein